ncbi:hypothetical protein NDU88_005152 [Pleurodeles waltl]|uniref:Uncharacterized protein n=1 Tax=Pleurodeles waltl TaxID=8319 RepID=A0AAV7SKY5_PLEWA|nr:hypothetical protein NDU88_005152 [Pleurodeles waltl]
MAAPLVLLKHFRPPTAWDRDEPWSKERRCLSCVKFDRPRGKDGGEDWSGLRRPVAWRRSSDCGAKVVRRVKETGAETQRVGLRAYGEERRWRHLRRSPWLPRGVFPLTWRGRPGPWPECGGGGLGPESWPRATLVELGWPETLVCSAGPTLLGQRQLV